jgi:signal peptidase II
MAASEAGDAALGMTRGRGVFWFVALSLAGASLDLWTKALAFARVPDHGLDLVAGCLSLRKAMNTGAAFSMFPGQFTFFYAVAGAAMLLLCWFAWSAPRGTSWRFSALLGMLGSGVLGNLYDRVFLGGVRDFVDVYVGYAPVARKLIQWFKTNHWPTFNLADAFICVGAGCLLIAFTRESIAGPAAGDPRPRGSGRPVEDA